MRDKTMRINSDERAEEDSREQVIRGIGARGSGGRDKTMRNNSGESREKIAESR